MTYPPGALGGRMIGGVKAKPNTVYAKASTATWELVWAACLSGLSAPTVSARFG